MVGNNPHSARVLKNVAKLLEENTVDVGLVERLRAHDHSAVSDLADRYSSRIRQLALRYVRNEDDAEEVVQDVLLKVYQKIDAFRGDAALSSWIYRITFNTAMSRLRSERSSRHEAESVVIDAESGERSQQAGEIADWSSLADDEVMRGQLRERLVKALADLPPIYRVPVVLRDVQGLSTEEASAVLHVKDQTLKSRLHRGRMILRDRLSDFAGGLTLH
jgi:RNA polymerase sigma-70 factor, ECF subfamily